MYLHKEGYPTIIIATLIFAVLSFVFYYFFFDNYNAVFWILQILALTAYFLIISFFRIPAKNFTEGKNIVTAPCDGKVVVIEEVQPDEYFTDRRIQVSIFMSPLNVHVNLNPVSGKIVYNQYHKGKYLVAWHPKSSTENERHTNVYRRTDGIEILTKQIAGALARRIVNYNDTGKEVAQNAEMGFIKFGSRVDLLLPLHAKINVKIGDVAVGGVTVIAEV